jgi:hypothetical protein
MVKIAKKLFTVSVVVMTIVWSVGLAAFLPAVVVAATCPTLQAGDLFKIPGNSAVYLVNADGKRMYFFNAEVYKSWYADYSGVQEIAASCTDTYPSGGAVAYRPGSKLVKTVISPSVYAVQPNGQLLKIADEASAKALYGANWTKLVRDLADVYFDTYVVGTGTLTDTPHNGMLVMKEGTTDVYNVVGGKLYKVDGTLGAAAKGDVRTVSATVFGKLEVAGTTVTAASVTDTPYQAGKTTGTTTNNVVSGTLNLSLSADTPAGKTVPLAATNIDVLKFNAANPGSTDAILDEVVLKRTGVGAVTGLTAYLYDGEARVGTGKTFTSDANEAIFSALNYTVKAGTTKTFTIRLKTTSGSTGDSAFSVTSAKLAAGTVGGSMPLMGSMFTMGTATAGSVTVAGNGTLSNPVIGDTNVALTQFKLTAGTEDVDVYSFTLKQDGTISTDLLSNYTLWNNTTKLDATYSVSGRYVTFVLAAPLRIVNGNNKIITVKGDVSANTDLSKTVVFFMYDTNDLKAIGNSYGYGTSVDTDSYNAAGDSQTLTPQGGGVTISNKSQSAHDVKVDTTEVELGKVAITSKSDTVTVQALRVSLATTKVASSSANTGDWGTYRDVANDGDYDASTDTLLIRNIKLKDMDTGRTLGSAKAITDATSFAAGSTDVDTTLNFDYTDYFTIAKGTTRNVAVVADVYSSQISDVKYTATFNFTSSYFTVKDSKDQTVTDIVPATTIASYAVTTKSSSLTISRASTPETRTVVKGSTSDVLGLIFSTGSGTGNDVKLSGLTLHGYVDADVDGTFVAAVEGTVDANELAGVVGLYVGGTKIAEASVNSSGNVVFDSSKFVGGYYNIPAGTNKTVVVKAELSGNAPYGGTDDALAFTFAAADVTVEANGTTFTPTVTGTNVNGTTSPSVSARITGYGTITTAANSGKPDAAILIAGSTSEQEVHRVSLTATKEAWNVEKLTVLVSSTDAYDDVEYVQLYKADGTRVGPEGGVGLDSSGRAIFDSLTLTVPNTGETVVIVKAKLKAIGERTTATVGTAGSDADTGDNIEFRLETTDTYFKAVATSGQTDTAADAAVGNIMVVRKAKPTVSISALPSATLALGSNTGKTLMKFTVSADSGDVVLGSIKPYITFNDADGAASFLTMASDSLYVYDVTGAETQLNGVTAGYGANAAASTSGQFEINFDTGRVVTIAAGATRTFEVRADITGVEAGDSIETKFVRDAAALSDATETFANAYGDSNDDFVWSDQSADTDGVASTEWVNGYLLNLPTTASSVSKSS